MATIASSFIKQYYSRFLVKETEIVVQLVTISTEVITTQTFKPDFITLLFISFIRMQTNRVTDDVSFLAISCLLGQKILDKVSSLMSVPTNLQDLWTEKMY